MFSAVSRHLIPAVAGVVCGYIHSFAHKPWTLEEITRYALIFGTDGIFETFGESALPAIAAYGTVAQWEACSKYLCHYMFNPSLVSACTSMRKNMHMIKAVYSHAALYTPPDGKIHKYAAPGVYCVGWVDLMYKTGICQHPEVVKRLNFLATAAGPEIFGSRKRRSRMWLWLGELYSRLSDEKFLPQIKWFHSRMKHPEDKLSIVYAGGRTGYELTKTVLLNTKLDTQWINELAGRILQTDDTHSLQRLQLLPQQHINWRHAFPSVFRSKSPNVMEKVNYIYGLLSHSDRDGHKAGLRCAENAYVSDYKVLEKLEWLEAHGYNVKIQLCNYPVPKSDIIPILEWVSNRRQPTHSNHMSVWNIIWEHGDIELAEWAYAKLCSARIHQDSDRQIPWEFPEDFVEDLLIDDREVFHPHMADWFYEKTSPNLQSVEISLMANDIIVLPKLQWLVKTIGACIDVKGLLYKALAGCNYWTLDLLKFFVASGLCTRAEVRKAMANQPHLGPCLVEWAR